MKKLLQQEIRELSNGEHLKLNAETRTISVQGYGENEGAVPGVHDDGTMNDSYSIMFFWDGN